MRRAPVLVFVLVLVPACGGRSPASPNECGAAVESAVTVGMRAQIEGQHLTEATVASIKTIAIKHCVDDKWPTSVVSCVKRSTTNDTINACLEGIPAAVRFAWQQDMAAELARAGSGSSGSSGSGSATVAPGELPVECTEYKAVLARLASCNTFPADILASYQQAYDQLVQASGGGSSTELQQTQLAQGCRTTVDVIRQSAAATCGW